MTSIAKISKLRESLPTTRRGKRTASLDDSQITAAWLTATKGSAAYRRIRALHAYLDRLDGLLSGRLQPTAKNEWVLQQQAANDLLARYSFTPQVAVCDPTLRRRYALVPRRLKGRTIEVTDGCLSYPVDEALVAAALARLYAAGQLFHVHLCDHCRATWHARVREMDRFCSRACQVAHYTSSPKARENNRLAQIRHRGTSG
jgi:hypothetical protein